MGYGTKQGVKTANMYWVAADIPIKIHFYLSKLFRQKPQLTFEERIDTVISWLRMRRGTPATRHALFWRARRHRASLRSAKPGNKKKVEYLDSLVGVLMHKISRLPIADRINLIVTSDHGMTEISDERVVNMHPYLKPEWCRVIDGKNANIGIYKARIQRFGVQFIKMCLTFMCGKRKKYPPNCIMAAVTGLAT